jgi:hypothetical protein
MWTAFLPSKKSLAAGHHSNMNTGPGATNTIAKRFYEPDAAFLFEMTLDATSLC